MSHEDVVEVHARRFLEEAIGPGKSEELGEYDWDNNFHLKETPGRFGKLLMDMTTPEEFNFTVFDNTEMVDEMVVVANIPFYSLCAHHIVPFFGKAHVAYIPARRLCGISKLARCVKYHAKGLQVQEHLTNDIADHIDSILNPIGVAVVMQAEHLCMTMRGVQAAGTITHTSKMIGAFLDPEKQARQEFFELVRSTNG